MSSGDINFTTNTDPKKKGEKAYLRQILDIVRNWLKTVGDDKRHVLPIDNEMRYRNMVRGGAVMFCLLCLALAVGLKFWKLQYVEHEKHQEQVSRILGFRQTLLGTRGEIYDRDNNLLAGNIRTRDLFVTPRLVVDAPKADLAGFCQFLSEKLPLTKEQLLVKCSEALTKDVRVLVKDYVGRDNATKIARMRLPGVIVENCKEIGFQNCFTIYICPLKVNELEQLRGVVGVLEATLSLEGNQLAKNINRILHKGYAVPVAKNLSFEDAEKIQKSFLEWAAVRNASGKFLRYRVPVDALHFDETTMRYYPKGRMLSNTLGFCDDKEHGVSGIERLMDKELTRLKGQRYIALDGNVLSSNYVPVAYDDKLNGYAVHLTIQYPIQSIVERVMGDVIQEHRPERAYALMMDPRTGAILSLYQYPNFDFNDKSTFSVDNCQFHALLGAYEPGSIMKAVSVSSAMDYANLKPDFMVDCENGRWIYGNRALHEHGNARFGDISIKEVIQKSSNIGSAKLVIENMSEQVFYNYLRTYGLGSKSRVGFYPQGGEPHTFFEETSGILRSVEKWYKVDVSRIAIGHSISISPFQMVQAYCAICNGGRMMQPYIVDRIVSAEGKVIPSVPFVKAQPISSVTASRMLECLSATVERGGTATSAVVEGYNVAGKTGTAMKLVKGPDGKKRYSRSLNTASFIGLVPLENPVFVLLITVDEPKGKMQYGGSVCGKPFSRIATETLRLMQVPPSENTGVARQ
ncbi:MAG: penicillin-binding protein 2 [Victivallales bacterium]|nr:penicillin-binding protein 2 [Victivallales bacterium]